MKYLLSCFILFISISLSFAQSKFITTFKTDNYGGPSRTIAMGNKLFFSAYDPVNGRELWCTDGTAPGTYMVKDINPGSGNGIADYFEYTVYVMNGILYFKGNDGITGPELWRSDGTAAGTYLLKDLTAGATGTGIGYFTSVNNILYFTGGTGTQLWRSDGTDTGTYVIDYFMSVSNLYGFKNKLYFAGDKNNTGQELWKSDGTNTFLLKDLNGALGASLPCNFHATPSTLYFMAMTNDGWELWKTTGSAASTVMVKDINPNGNSVLGSYAEANMANIDDTVYFGAMDGVNGYQLWKSDGTDTGTVMCTNIPNAIYTSSLFPVVNGRVLVNNYTDNHFWEYDPVTDSVSVSAYPSFFYSNNPGKFIFVGDKMIYVAADSIYGCEVWKADGTAQGVNRLQESHLVDNWIAPTSQNFNSVFGKIGNTVLYTIVRTPYGFDIALRSYDASQTDSCFAPSVIVPVPVSDTAAHFVWNRINDNAQYDFRYRIAGSGSWNTVTTGYSYLSLNNLADSADYEYQLRTTCNAVTTGWSDTATFNTGYISNHNVVNILADRSENDSTMRIYWLRSDIITSMQMKYRISGTAAWTTVSNATGYKRITGLQPNILYEYLLRPNYNGTWGLWTYTPLYFYVSAPLVTTYIPELSLPENKIKLFPIPSANRVFIEGFNDDNIKYDLIDLLGHTVRTGEAIENSIDLEELTGGIYFIKLKSKEGIVARKVIKN
ncbi:MAG: ELWxxDGT repeat protein [Bacteroidia bacterium]